ncbi:hypothetical protein DACRYDRAFT_23030 [Dacryopinax primogenitus]|uniref:Uncharacterized protein n=1 Tax=Dacryopinax primogenitus (strain DJM 731) TaxID=1858805 RepID=M5FW51_DACPD|nr:uncharacterized protein DACRYDRAFT_23030 [Dacryopinax primogenitus]EJU00594.1 hypothetical protein DACRYDRAFT_23030 [Dacryopinax primogenitus]
MARVISLDREAQRKADLARQESAPSVSSGLPSPHISTPNPFEETIRFESPAPMNGLVRSASQIERLGPKRMDTTSSSYSRSSFR